MKSNGNLMRRIFITGSTTGLGLAAARALIDAGHAVVLHARSAARAAAIGELASRAHGVVIGDLASAAETDAVAAQVNRIGRMDAVIHNAGHYAARAQEPAATAYATTLAVNTLAPYRLTALMHRPERLVYLSSNMHFGGRGPLGDATGRGVRWGRDSSYSDSKLYVTALAFAVARRWPEVMSNAVDPGWVPTRMGGAGAPDDLAQGHGTQAWLAVSDEPAARVSGRYWYHRKPQAPAPQALDPRFQAELVDRLAAITGITLP